MSVEGLWLYIIKERVRAEYAHEISTRFKVQTARYKRRFKNKEIV